MDVAGGKMKQTDFTHWESPNSGASNESGFTGLPGGARVLGSFNALGQSGNWWSSTSLGSDAWLKSLFYSQVFLGLFHQQSEKWACRSMCKGFTIIIQSALLKGTLVFLTVFGLRCGSFFTLIKMHQRSVQGMVFDFLQDHQSYALCSFHGSIDCGNLGGDIDL